VKSCSEAVPECCFSVQSVPIAHVPENKMWLLRVTGSTWEVARHDRPTRWPRSPVLSTFQALSGGLAQATRLRLKLHACAVEIVFFLPVLL
jgi:hypothetical protein